MSTHTFRFGIVSGLAADAASWQAEARRAEELGYSALLIPDTLRTLSPFPALAAAASVTSTLRVGAQVMSVANRTPGALAREVETLDLLSGGRFVLGLGLGRPAAAAAAERLGQPWGSPAERLAQLRASIAAVRDQLATRKRPMVPVLLAGTGPRLLELAAAEADILTLSVPQETTEDQLVAKAEQFRALPGGGDVELAVNTITVGDDLPEAFVRYTGIDLDALRAAGSYGVLDGTPEQIADTLRRRRDRAGISFVTVSGMFADKFAPVVEMLAGT
jgi:probable F420-dependent oxidoreductase